jgi:hypothetical protein
MKTVRIYSDESRHKNERFLLLSALMVEEENVVSTEKEIIKLREKHGYINDQKKKINFTGELKWTKVSDKYFSVYQELTDIFFNWINKGKARFCTMLVDTQDPMVLSYSNIKKEGYFKLLYQLYYHNSKVPGIYKIFPDRITNPKQHKVDFSTMEKILERGFQKKFIPLLNPEEHNPPKGFINNITPIDSKTTEYIQIIDVIMGGIGYFQNQLFRRKGAKKAKVKLMKYIFEKMFYSGYMKIISKKFMIVKSNKFNIWIFRPKQNKEV